MNRFFIITLFLLLAASLNCKNDGGQYNRESFTFRSDYINLPFSIRSAVFHQEYIVCLTDNGDLKILDMSGQPQEPPRNLLSDQPFIAMQVISDSIILADKIGYWYLTDEFQLRHYERNANQFKYGLPLYTDNRFEVFGCSAGEWGGAVFFFDKSIDKTYAFRSLCPQQVLKWKGEYFVSNYLAHLSGYSNFLLVSEPDQSPEYKTKRAKLDCHILPSNVSEDFSQFINSGLSNVKEYGLPFPSANLTSFATDTSMYTILTCNTGTYLAMHAFDTLKVTDTIFKSEIFFDHSTSLVKDDVTISVLKYGMTSIGEYETEFENALVVVNNRAIHFLFGIQRQLKKYSSLPF